MNHLRDALLAAGIITLEHKRRIEKELAAQASAQERERLHESRRLEQAAGIALSNHCTAPSYSCGVLPGAGQNGGPLIYSINTRALARGMRTEPVLH